MGRLDRGPIRVTKPCPFCGSTLIGSYFVQLPTVKDKTVNWRYRFCETCHAQGPRALTETQATVKWNKRDKGDQNR
jgi:Lar family restriction alleviation protein